MGIKGGTALFSSGVSSRRPVCFFAMRRLAKSADATSGWSRVVRNAAPVRIFQNAEEMLLDVREAEALKGKRMRWMGFLRPWSNHQIKEFYTETSRFRWSVLSTGFPYNKNYEISSHWWFWRSFKRTQSQTPQGTAGSHDSLGTQMERMQM